MATTPKLTISAFVKLLQRSYPAITASKVRYLERKGLLQPMRTEGRYRLFSEDDVTRALRILEMQAEYLPLKVIKQRLSEPVQEEVVDILPSKNFEEYKDAKYHLIEQAQADLNVSVAFIQELAACGFIKLTKNADKKVQVAGEDYPQILRCHALFEAGIEPRNIRFLVIGAGHQIALLEQVLAATTTQELPQKASHLSRLMEDVQKNMVLSTFKSRNKE